MLLGSARLADAVDVGPLDLPLKVGGIAVNVPARIQFEPRPWHGVLILEGYATGDLAEIQARALAIARALPWPHDPCRRKGVNVVVESIDAASATAVDAGAAVTLAGKVGVWACERLLGAKIKTRIVADRVVLDATLAVTLRGPGELGLRLAGRPRITTGRPEIRQAAESLGDVDAVLAAVLERLLDTAAARAKLPQLTGIELTLAQAQFVKGAKTLVLRVDGTAKLSTAALASLLALGKR